VAVEHRAVDPNALTPPLAADAAPHAPAVIEVGAADSAIDAPWNPMEDIRTKASALFGPPATTPDSETSGGRSLPKGKLAAPEPNPFPKLEDNSLLDDPMQIFQVWNHIIRPPRTRYECKDLGPPNFMTSSSPWSPGVEVIREDHRVQRDDRMLHCSVFEPAVAGDVDRRPIVVYCHGNSSCRVGALEAIPVLLPIGCAVCAFDFSGCGMSDGEYVSLGWNETEDLRCILSWLRNRWSARPIGVWGRSMGAATALLYMPQDTNIVACVLDSPFANLSALVQEIAEGFCCRIIVSACIQLVRCVIQQKAGFDICRVNPIDYVGKSSVPALFLAGKWDAFVRPEHARDLHDRYLGDKELALFDGDHNSVRPREVYNAIQKWFLKRFRAVEECQLPDVSSSRRFDFHLHFGRVRSNRNQKRNREKRISANGLYEPGDAVEYYSATFEEWISARVVDVSGSGGVELDVKRGAYLGPAVQQERLRFPGILWAVGDELMLKTESGDWMPVVVESVGSRGEVVLDMLPNQPLSPTEQRTKLRKREASQPGGCEAEVGGRGVGEESRDQLDELPDS